MQNKALIYDFPLSLYTKGMKAKGPSERTFESDYSKLQTFV